MPISRRTDTITVAMTNDAATTGIIDFSGYAGGMIFIPNGSGIDSFTWHAAPSATGTFEPAYDKNDVAVTQVPDADRAVPIPEALFGAGAIKAVVDTDGTVTVSLKT